MAQMIAGTDYSVIKSLFKGRVFNEPVEADTDIFDSDLEPTVPYTTFRIYACLSVSGTLSIMRTRDEDTVQEELNAGVALTADAAYMFDILVEEDETINLWYSVNATVISLKVFEVPGVIS